MESLLKCNAMKERIYAERVETLRERLASLNEGHPSALWVLHPDNRRYLSGFRAEDYHITESSGSLLITATKVYLITDPRYTLEAEREAVTCEVYTHQQGIVEALSSLVKGLGITTLGFEPTMVTFGLHQELVRELGKTDPPVRLKALDPWIEAMRETKNPEEVKALEKAGHMISEILGEVIDWIKPGLTEREVAGRLDHLAREAGADRSLFPPSWPRDPTVRCPMPFPRIGNSGPANQLSWTWGSSSTGIARTSPAPSFLKNRLRSSGISIGSFKRPSRNPSP